MKDENTPTHHRSKYNVSGTTQATFLAMFKVSSNKLSQKTPPHCGGHYALCDLLWNTENKLKLLLKAGSRLG